MYIYTKFPCQREVRPSSLTIILAACQTFRYFASTPLLVCTWNRIFSKSSGAATIRPTTPANAPASILSSTFLRSKPAGSLAAAVATTRFPLNLPDWPTIVSHSTRGFCRFKACSVFIPMRQASTCTRKQKSLYVVVLYNYLIAGGEPLLSRGFKAFRGFLPISGLW